MHKAPFSSTDEFQNFLLQSTLKDFKASLSHFSLTELAESFFLLEKGPSMDSKNKQSNLFHFLDNPGLLESLGKHFSVKGWIGFLHFLGHSSYLDRLPFILIGLPPSIFSQALPDLNEQQIATLKQEAFLEPLQYHLMQFTHEGESIHQHIQQLHDQLISHFQSIEPHEVTKEILDELLHSIDNLSIQLSHYTKCKK